MRSTAGAGGVVAAGEAEGWPIRNAVADFGFDAMFRADGTRREGPRTRDASVAVLGTRWVQFLVLLKAFFEPPGQH